MLKSRLCRDNGFTLIEMIVVMAVFIVVLIITSNAFNLIVTKSKNITTSEESNIEGVIGLEMFRHDLEQTGFGLFNDVDSPSPTYSETTGTLPATYNDGNQVPPIPRAFIAGDNLNKSDNSIILTGTDYVVIKATTVSNSLTSQKWSYVNGLGTSRSWGNSNYNLLNGVDRVIVAKQTYKNNELYRRLVYDPATPGTYSATYKDDASYSAPFVPTADGVLYVYYGIDNTAALRAPFNRTDYVVKRIAGSVPARCSPGTGVLYKTTMDQTSGAMTDVPVLECVADMQVVLGWDTSDTIDNAVDMYSNADVSSRSGPLNSVLASDLVNDPQSIRKRLKLIKVYILAQDGKYDPNFANTSAMVVGDSSSGETTLTKSFDITGASYKNYRWKLYRIVVRPKNLN